MSVECNLEVWYIIDDVESLTQNRPEYMTTLVIDKESLERTCEIWRRHLTPVHTDTSTEIQRDRRVGMCVSSLAQPHRRGKAHLPPKFFETGSAACAQHHPQGCRLLSGQHIPYSTACRFNTYNVERVVSAPPKHELHLEQQFACLERNLSQQMSERMSIVEIKLDHMITTGLGLRGSLETEVESVGNVDVEVLPGTCL
jgi:hypothetical protein